MVAAVDRLERARRGRLGRLGCSRGRRRDGRRGGWCPRRAGPLTCRHRSFLAPRCGDAGDGLADRHVIGLHLLRTLEVFQCRSGLAGPEIQEADALERIHAHGVELQGGSPRVERAGQIALVAQNPRHQVVRVGQTGIAGQSAAGDFVGRIELPPPPQRLCELQEGQAPGLVGQPRGQGSDIVSHGTAPAPS
jgi:hypothetical protein